MKIVDVCAFYAPQGGGVRTYIDRKLAIGPAMGHDITIIAPGDSDRVETRRAGARIVWLQSPRLPVDFKYRYFADAGRLHAALDAERPDILECSSPWRSASMVGNWPGPAPRAMIMHADPLSAYAYRWFEGVASRPAIDRQFDWYWRHLRRLDARFDAIISAGDSLTRRMREGGLRGMVTIPMGTEPGVFSPRLRDAALRTRLLARCGLGPDATLLIGIGRHAPEKRWPMVIDAVTLAGHGRPVGLILIGDGRSRTSLMRHAGDNPHIHLMTPVSDRQLLARILASGDALIHGCEAETFCMVAAEAQASGLTIIAPIVVVLRTLCSNYGGYCYASGDARGAAAAVTRFIDDGGASTPRAHHSPRSFEDHFAELFRFYADFAQQQKYAA